MSNKIRSLADALAEDKKLEQQVAQIVDDHIRERESAKNRKTRSEKIQPATGRLLMERPPELGGSKKSSSGQNKKKSHHAGMRMGHYYKQYGISAEAKFRRIIRNCQNIGRHLKTASIKNMYEQSKEYIDMLEIHLLKELRQAGFTYIYVNERMKTYIRNRKLCDNQGGIPWLAKLK